MARDARRLRVFETAHELVVEVHRLSQCLPEPERYGLASQLRRASVSIPTSIAQGCSRRSVREYQRFLEIAVGSAAEVHYVLRLVVDLGLLPAEQVSHCRECSDHVLRALKKVQQTVEGRR